MKLKMRLSMAALMLMASGCGGGNGGGSAVGAVIPPAAPPGGGGGVPPPTMTEACDAGARRSAIGGIWIGEPQESTTERARLLAAETGEFRLLSPDGWSQQIFGTFQFDDMNVSTTDAISVSVVGLTWLETDSYPLDIEGSLDEQGGLFLEFDLPVAFDTAVPHVTFSLTTCDTLYERDSSIAILAGTYIGGSTTLAIDDQGEIFYQHGNCVGNGRAEVIDPDFNMYRMEIEVEGCTGNTVHAPGRLFAGLAYLGDSADTSTNDVIEFALSSANADSTIAWGQMAQR